MEHQKIKSVFVDQDVKQQQKYCQYGHVRFLLKEYLAQRQMTRYQLATLADISYRTIDRYYKNQDLGKIDFDLIARICYCLDCQLEDILEYVPTKEK